MAKYKAVKRIEERDEKGVKTVYKSGSVLELTKERAKSLGDAVVPMKAGLVPAESAGDSGAGAGDPGAGSGQGDQGEGDV